MDEIDVESLSQEEMIRLMIRWSRSEKHRGTTWYRGDEDALADLCRAALYAIGRDDWGGCVLCRD